jgi:subtilisin family serine protease
MLPRLAPISGEGRVTGRAAGVTEMTSQLVRSVLTLMAGAALLAARVSAAPGADRPPYLDFARGPRLTAVTRGTAGGEKLAPELQLLYRQISAAPAIRRDPLRYTDSQLRRRFGIARGETDPSVVVAARVAPGTSTAAVAAAGATVLQRIDDIVYAVVPIIGLERLAGAEGVRAVIAVKPPRLPKLPAAPPARVTDELPRGAGERRGPAPPGGFDRQGLTGKGVIVGLIDTGIDWRHPDFLREDGTTRVLYLWDMGDSSWKTSGGEIGSAPPELGDAKLQVGTLYTQEQINAALKGRGTVNSTDSFGHGTACAGTAAGNGRATRNGVPAGIYTGVAPEADLIVIKAGDDDELQRLYFMAAQWLATKAQSLGKPGVINMSFGWHDTAHDGTAPDEQFLDAIAGAGKPGVVICAAAGNEGRESFHVGGRFGPRRPEQADVESAPAELFITKTTDLIAYFDHPDDWGLAVTGLDKFLVDENGHPVHALFYRTGEEMHAALSATPKTPADPAAYFQEHVRVGRENDQTDRFVCRLPPGNYLVRGFGASEKVTRGQFDIYLPYTDEASFGRGVTPHCMICSPGNAGSVITVASYAFRSAWENLDGKQTIYNLPTGELSDYSSPGYRRDGVVKPDITAPAEFTISSLAADCTMARSPGRTHVTRDGYHLAWSGTSAASPYVVGVVALMLQKNPTLDAAQVRQILTTTAEKDRFTGAVPNPQWGYGKINPEAALRATSAAAGPTGQPAGDR